tara:strand:+ start:95 stop:280 length:186 start_codon:yes stop_codon:yes gene_type:complete
MASKKRVLKHAKSGALSLPAGHPFATPAEPATPTVTLEAPKVVVSTPVKKNSTRKKKTVKK